MFAPGAPVRKNGKGGSGKECDKRRRKSFDEWLDVKKKLDKGLKLFSQLDPSRANSDFLQVSSSSSWLHVFAYSSGTASIVDSAIWSSSCCFRRWWWCYSFCFCCVSHVD